MRLAHHELHQSIYRVEVFRHQLAVLDLQLEGVFEEHDDIEHADGVDRPGLEKRFAVVEHGRGVPHQQVVQHELADFRAQLVFVLHAESRNRTDGSCQQTGAATAAARPSWPAISLRSLGAASTSRSRSSGTYQGQFRSIRRNRDTRPAVAEGDAYVAQAVAPG